MPDRHGFDLLGDRVRCIWCGACGDRWEWPEQRRGDHACRPEDDLEDDARRAREAETHARRERRHRSRFWLATHKPRACANPYCSEVFTPKRSTRIYCKDACRRATARRANGA